jgi:hypothetical protein
MIEDHADSRARCQEYKQRLGSKLPEALAPNTVRKTHARSTLTVTSI